MAIEGTNSYADGVFLKDFDLHTMLHVGVEVVVPSTSTMAEGSNNNSQQSAASLLSKELFEMCKSESISEEGVREIFERYRLTHKNNHVDNYKFFRLACSDERVTEGIIRCFLEYFPDAASAADERGCSPLLCACNSKGVTLNIIQLLVESAPDSVRSVNNNGNMPLHALCNTRQTDDAAAIQILKFLIEKHPEGVRHPDNIGRLPIHIAAGGRSPEFCRVLIEACPGSEQISGAGDAMPLHFACGKGSLATVEYLYRQYPDAITTPATPGYPIHAAIFGIKHRNSPATAAEVVQFLLDCDPNQKLIQSQGMSLLRIAFWQPYNGSNIAAAIQISKILFDAHPEAIEDERIASNIRRYHQQVQAFINGELVYARQAKDLRRMMTPDTDGRLPLHRALQNNVRLGSIKLLIKGNPSAIRSIDDSGALPLHVACQHHDSASVVGYVLDLARITRDATDSQGNTALHYACRGAKYNTIAMLLEKYDAASVSKRNAHGKLPIDLLWESTVSDRESVEYIGSVFQLVRANPEMVIISNSIVNQPVDVGTTRK